MITEELKKHVVEFVEMEQHSYSMDLMILEYVARSLQITKKDAADISLLIATTMNFSYISYKKR